MFYKILRTIWCEMALKNRSLNLNRIEQLKLLHETHNNISFGGRPKL